MARIASPTKMTSVLGAGSKIIAMPISKTVPPIMEIKMRRSNFNRGIQCDLAVMLWIANPAPEYTFSPTPTAIF